MIFDGPNPDFKKVAERNKAINEHQHGNSLIPCCGHDFWEQARKMDFGDVVLCPRCNVYYAKIKHAPWIVEPSTGFYWEKNKLKSCKFGNYHTNHLGFDEKRKNYMFSRKKEFFMIPVTARVTD